MFLYTWVLFFARGFISLFVALIIKKYHHPSLYTQGLRASTKLSYRLSSLFAHFLLVLRAGAIPTRKSNVWQICLLILDLVDIAALILLDYLGRKNAENREKLISANERAQGLDEIIRL